MSNDAWVWEQAQICAESRYIKKCGVYWNTFVKNQRFLHSWTARPIIYQCLETFCLVPAWIERAFCRLTAVWSKLKVPHGGIAELLMIFSYNMLELMDPESRWWVFACVELDLKTDAFVLMDVYDNYRLWALSL